MPSNDIDDLFRDGLAGHATPPAEALWQRLQAREAAAAAVAAVGSSEATPLAAAPQAAATPDAQFRAGLERHVSAVPREVWERLEDEHLRPRKQRRTAAGWWPLAAAAVVALLLLVGGVGLLPNGWLGNPAATDVATTVGTKAADAARAAQETQVAQGSGKPAKTMGAAADASPENSVASPGKVASEKNTVAQATPASPATSTATRSSNPARPTTAGQPQAAPPALAAAVAAARQPAPKPGQSVRDHAALVAAKPATKAAGQLAPKLLKQPQELVATGPALEVRQPAPSTPPAGVILVEVRHGGGVPALAAAPQVAAADVAARDERRGPGRGLGRLLGRAGRVVQDAREGIATVASLPDNVTLEARLGDRTLSKTIQL